jgi:hypothetical protein
MTDRRSFLAAGGALALSACATPPLGSPAAIEVPAPRWSVGDSWTFRRTDAYNGLDRGDVTRTVESATERGIRVVTRHAGGAVLEDALFESPGVQISGTLDEEGLIAGAFAPRLRRYDFPLVSGKRWEQQLTRTDSNQSRYYFTASTQVEGWEEIGLGERSYRAIIVRRTLRLGHRPVRFGNLQREELEWYAPELRTGARVRIFEWLLFAMHTEPSYRLNVQLESFRLA